MAVGSARLMDIYRKFGLCCLRPDCTQGDRVLTARTVLCSTRLFSVSIHVIRSVYNKFLRPSLSLCRTLYLYVTTIIFLTSNGVLN